MKGRLMNDPNLERRPRASRKAAKPQRTRGWYCLLCALAPWREIPFSAGGQRAVPGMVPTGVEDSGCAGDFLPVAARIPLARAVASFRTRHGRISESGLGNNGRATCLTEPMGIRQETNRLGKDTSPYRWNDILLIQRLARRPTDGMTSSSFRDGPASHLN
jgi:hypothetical protein